MKRNVDPVTVEIIGNLLLSVAEEMGATLVKTAVSTNIKERKDCSTAVFDARGKMVAQAEHIPMHLGSMLGIVEEILKKYPLADILPGDMFIANDPYAGGGTHLPDITTAAPVFAEGRLVGFVANLAHHADVGGKVPGSTSGDANSVFQEGLRIPLVRICRAGEFLQETADFILVNSRTPNDRVGDLGAQVAANQVGVRRMEEIVAKYGADRFEECTEALLDYAEALMRAGVRTLPDGTYSFEDFLDDDGINLGKPVPIKVSVTIKDDVAHLDFAGTSGQVAGPLNVTMNGLLATVFYCFKALVGPDIPSNHGIYRALQVTAPLGSIVNCTPPAPVGQRIDTCQRVADVIFGAMAKAAPERVIAACNSTVTTATFSGVNPRNDQFYVYLETIAGGSGAHSRADGLSGVQVHMTNTSNLPVEALEREYPLLVERYQFRTDSGGAGIYRGGLGIQRDIRVLHENCTFSGLADRQMLSPWGLEGGGDGLPGEFIVMRQGEEPFKVSSKVSGVAMAKEDLLRVQTPGAGGYGNPFKRNPEAVLRDVLEGKVTREAAERQYGVVLTADATGVDNLGTERLRAGVPR